MAGIIFDDTVLLSRTRRQSDPRGLPFHELVHVLQYEVLGVAEFARQYVHGYAANNFTYERITLEVAAHELEKRALAAPRSEFSVTVELWPS